MNTHGDTMQRQDSALALVRGASIACIAVLGGCMAVDKGADVDLSSSALSGEVTLFSSTDQPTILADGDAQAVELGLRFRADVAGQVSGVRFLKSSTNTGSHIGHLWTNSGTLLATVTFSGETASGWQTARFATPVAIQPGVTYVVSYHTDVGDRKSNV